MKNFAYVQRSFTFDLVASILKVIIYFIVRRLMSIEQGILEILSWRYFLLSSFLTQKSIRDIYDLGKPMHHTWCLPNEKLSRYEAGIIFSRLTLDLSPCDFKRNRGHLIFRGNLYKKYDICQTVLRYWTDHTRSINRPTKSHIERCKPRYLLLRRVCIELKLLYQLHLHLVREVVTCIYFFLLNIVMYSVNDTEHKKRWHFLYWW